MRKVIKNVTVNGRQLKLNFQQYSDEKLDKVSCPELGTLTLGQLRYLDEDIVRAYIRKLSPDSKVDLLGQICPTTAKYLAR